MRIGSAGIARVLCGLLAWSAGTVGWGAEPELDKLLADLKAVGADAAGHEQAAAAWQRLAEMDVSRLTSILAGMDGASPLAANWIALAAQTVAERGSPSAADLERFVLDRSHAPRGRRLAYELLLRADLSAEDRLVPQMLDDPARELRRDAVEQLIAKANRAAEKGDKQAAAAIYQRALRAVWDLDQARLVSDRLRELGQSADLARQLGFITRWKLIGPFDNTGLKGLGNAYPPESGIEVNATYAGKLGEVRWVEFTSEDRFGRIDFFKPFGNQREVVGYAATEFVADEAQEAELRMSSANANKLWLNGQLVHEYPTYHRGTDFDQFIDRVTLKAGRNVILVKVCQNEQTQDWAQRWDFQLRVCDLNGAALHSADERKE